MNIFTLFDQQVALRPDAVALVAQGQALSYRQLGQKVDALAAVLLAQTSFAAETRVALCLDRSPDMVIAMLAVMKAGAAYVPIDPGGPPERFATIVAAGDCRWLISQSRHQALIHLALGHLDAARPVIWSDRLAPSTTPKRWPRLSDAQLAYVMFTSGSTGKPKGVMVEHRQVSNTLSAMAGVYAIGAGTERVGAFANVTFDVSVAEIFGCLCFGGQLHLLDNSVRKDCNLLFCYLVQHQLNYLYLPPAVLALLPKQALPHLRALVIAGEPCDKATAVHWSQSLPLHNYYGPTEAAIYATGTRVSAQQTTSIGCPLENTSALVLDEGLQPLADGVVGELFLAGAGLARGYCRAPGQTAERFLPNPYGDGTRLYRTGDLARRNQQGALEYCGRADQQVKIRGHRVEVAEVEAALLRTEEIAQARVIVADRGGVKALLAYGVPREGQRPGIDSIKAGLAKVLPEYMLPAGIVLMPALPLTPNGKLDRAALPAPDDPVAGGTPRNDTERTLCEIFATLLHVQRVGRGDHFFALGGNSILAMRASAEIHRRLGFPVSASAIHQHGTAAALAALTGGALTQIPSAQSDSAPLSFEQRRLQVSALISSEPSLYHVPKLWRLPAGIEMSEIQSLGDAIHRVCQRHRVLFSLYDDQEQQRDGGCEPMELEVLHLAGESDLRKAIGDRVQNPFDLQRDASLRAHCFHCADHYYVLLVWHHIAFDGLSLDIFIDELNTVLRAAGWRQKPGPEIGAAAGEEAPGAPAELLPQLPVQYRDYAAWQRRVLTPEQMQVPMDYWRAALAGAEAAELPADFPRPAIFDSSGAEMDWQLDASWLQRCESFARRRRTSLYALLLGAYALALAILGNRRQLVIGAPFSTRQHPDLLPLIGCFVNMLPLRIDLNFSLSVRDYLAKLHRLLGEAKAHQGLPFDQLVAAIAPPRDDSRHPLFQCVFNFEDESIQPVPDWAAPSFDQYSWLPTAPAMFDVTVTASKTRQGLRLRANYARTLFASETIAGLGVLILQLLEGMVDGDHSPLWSLVRTAPSALPPGRDSISRPGETEQGRTTLYQQFLQRVEAQPDKVAISQHPLEQVAPIHLSYGALHLGAEVLAAQLLAAGAAANGAPTVAIAGPRNYRWALAMLACARLGVAYVAIDEKRPAAQWSRMLEQAGCRCLLQTAEAAQIEQDSSAVTVLNIANLPRDCIQSLPRLSDITGDSLAYVMFTSGSTGFPKGVAVPQRGVLRLANDRSAVPIHESDRLLWTCAMAFDATTYEFWGTLLNGANLHLVPDDHLLQSWTLGEAIKGLSISAMLMTTQLFRQHLATDASLFRPLRQLIVGGEAMSADDIHRLRAADCRLTLVNGYGPTENTTFSTCFSIGAGDSLPAPGGELPIGYAIDQSYAYVVSRDGRVQPSGARGELWVGGEGLAAGYVRQPGTTAERFVPDAFSGRSGARLYRTGDLVRSDHRGRLIFEGRSDQQIKRRGFRIEPGEIEYQLQQLPPVAQARVLWRDAGHRGGDGQLLAYVVPRDPDAEWDGQSVFAQLATSLPTYMLPDDLIPLRALPLNANAKLDVSALPLPKAESRSTSRAPRTQREAALCEIWREVLCRPELGIDDHFFQLGGHSLLAVRLSALSRQRLGVEIPLSLIYRYPTIARLQDHLVTDQVPTIDRRPDGSAPALSHGQKGLLYLHQLDPGRSDYHIPFLFRVSELHSVLLLQALQRLCQRHPVLRTAYPMRGGDPVPVSVSGPVEVREKRLASQAELEKSIRRQVAEVFDLSRNPGLRLVHYRVTGEANHFVLLVLHHIAFDGWSQQVFFQELHQVFSGLQRGETVALPELPIDYWDYAHWQTQSVSSPALDEAREYWQAQLQDYAPLTLPVSASAAVSDSQGACVPLPLDPEISRRLDALARQQGVSRYAVLLGAVYLTLAHHCNRLDLVVGTVSDNRPHPETHGLVGFFANTLALRMRLSPSMPVTQLISTLFERIADAKRYQELPFDKVVQAWQKSPQAPLVQVFFDWNTSDDGEEASVTRLPWIEKRQLYLPAKFDWQFSLRDSAHSIQGELIYPSAQFNTASMQAVAATYQRALAALLERGGAPISQISLLPPDDLAALCQAGQGPSLPLPAVENIAAAFHARAATRADAVALVALDEQRHISYRCLAARVDRWAQPIFPLVNARAGTGQPPFVAVYLEKSIDAVTAILAVLQAGAAYVPLSPRQPAGRVSTLMRRSGAVAVICRRDQLPDELVDATPRVLDTGELDRAGPLTATADTQPQWSGSALAYLLFTSGSTGTPKAVMVQHRSVVNLIAHQQQSLNFNSAERALWTADYVFDASVEQLFLCLLTGATLCLAAQPCMREVKFLQRTLVDQKISHLHGTPGLLAVLAQTGLCSAGEGSGILPNLRVISAGEACTPQVKSAWGRTLINKYGPTETTVTAAQDLHYGTQTCVNSIGRAVANTRLLVLDDSGQPCPVGTPGELYIGGRALSLGYWCQPGLTAERFVPDPFAASGQVGERLYRSGDLMRWRPDNQGLPSRLEFIGRRDQQVQIRGFRVELSEIEHCLAGHDAIAQVRVHWWPHPQGVLCAYLVPKDAGLCDYLREPPEEGAAPEACVSQSDHLHNLVMDIRQQASTQLPDYMLPQALIPLAQLPLNISGKLDTTRLPPPQTRLETQYQEPATAGEQRLAALWSQLLHLPRVGREDDFFSLGGHSLLLMQLAAQIPVALGKDVGMAGLYRHSNLKSQAAYIAGAADAVCDTSSAAGEGGTAQPRARAPLSYGQRRLWFLHQYQGPTATYNIPLLMRLQEPVDWQCLSAALTRVFSAQPSLRCCFESSAEGPQQVLRDPPLPPSLEVLDSMAQLVAEIRRARMHTFDLNGERLCQVRLLQAGGDGPVVLFWLLHHSVFDGASKILLLQELQHHYGALLDGGGNSVPEPPPGSRLPSPALLPKDHNLELEFWQTYLQGLPPHLDLPTDMPRPGEQSHEGALHRQSLPQSLAVPLGRQARDWGVSVNSLMMSVFALLLSRWSGQSDLAIGMPVSLRDKPRDQSQIGFFVNTLVIRFQTPADKPLRHYVQAQHGQIMAALAHKELPFEQLVEVINPSRVRNITPLFQVVFSFQRQEAQTQSQIHYLELDELEQGVAHFDLTCAVTDGDQSMDIAFEYNTQLFDAATIVRLEQLYRQMLQSLVCHPDLVPVECRWLLPPPPPAPEVCTTEQLPVPSAFVYRAAQTAEKIAVTAVSSCGLPEHVSYGECVRRARLGARALAKQGVKSEERVGVVVSRHSSVIIDLLTVLFAGAAYVPIDNRFPAARIDNIRRQSLIRLTLCDGQLVGGAGREQCGKNSQDPPRGPEVHTGSLAYTLFTSGTTGTPKGVAVEHGSILNLLQGLKERVYGDQPLPMADMRIALNASLGFDASVQQWVTLLEGATLVMVPESIRADSRQMYDFFHTSAVDVVDCTPSLLTLLIEDDHRLQELPHIVLVGGEAIEQSLWDRLANWPHRSRFFNLYGPTECTVDACVRAIDTTCPVPSVGRALEGSQCYLVDEKGHLCPQGMPGEICIAGSGLARGYLGRGAMTAEKFVPNPWGQPGSRLYRSGDIGRILNDGSLQFLYRRDQQVKLRGYRIELGEINAVMTQCDEIKQAASHVLPGEQAQLVCYLVGDEPAPGQPPLSSEECRGHAQSQLPSYMVPSVFVWLPSLPLTASGKLDVRALPPPSKSAAREFVAPTTEVEKGVAEIWQELLKINDPVSTADDFFELGGHSLLATRMLTMVNERWSIALPLAVVFDAVRLADFARQVEKECCEGRVSSQKVEAFHVDGEFEMEEFEL
ncbi:amino acid adenylation domain-containing protein [Microbulbifer discodermiae]|uniref:amino acid adenylation domain-containing protein n=1 Tax=Microbulbifer sp. 2201CG32-9 TaxID=3232309 RepID=UPI00345C4A8F